MNKNKKGKSNHKARLPFFQLIIIFTLMYESHPFILFPISFISSCFFKSVECLSVPVRDYFMLQFHQWHNHETCLDTSQCRRSGYQAESHHPPQSHSHRTGHILP